MGREAYFGPSRDVGTTVSVLSAEFEERAEVTDKLDIVGGKALRCCSFGCISLLCSRLRVDEDDSEELLGKLAIADMLQKCESADKDHPERQTKIPREEREACAGWIDCQSMTSE